MKDGVSRRAVVAGLGAVAAGVAASGGAALGAELSAQHGFNDEWIEWRLFDDGMQIAKRENKPVFILFHATWCPYCRAYREVFFEVQVVELLEGFTPILVDVDQQPDLNERYGEHGKYIPRSMILDPDGAHQAQIMLESKPERAYNIQESEDLQNYLRQARREFGLPEIS